MRADLGKLVGDVVAAVRRDGGRIELQAPAPATASSGQTAKAGTGGGTGGEAGGEAGPFTAFVRPIGLKRCLTNLLNNARRHAEHISVSLARNGDYLEIAVDDDGPGIPEALRAEVFRPFRRLDDSRNLDSGGTGLGLSVARDVARSHGGDIILSTAPTGGLRALVRLPA